MQRVFAFVDGSYLRTHGEKVCGTQYIDVKALTLNVTRERGVLDGRLIRACYYDAEPSDSADTVDPKLAEYWRRIERSDDVELRFGFLRSRSRKAPRQQKGVDVLLAVDLVVGAFTKLFDAAILLTGDVDFVPAVDEARRRGIIVILCGFKRTMSDVLIDACDRTYELDEAISRFKMGAS